MHGVCQLAHHQYRQPTSLHISVHRRRSGAPRHRRSSDQCASTHASRRSPEHLRPATCRPWVATSPPKRPRVHKRARPTTAVAGARQRGSQACCAGVLAALGASDCERRLLRSQAARRWRRRGRRGAAAASTQFVPPRRAPVAATISALAVSTAMAVAAVAIRPVPAVDGSDGDERRRARALRRSLPNTAAANAPRGNARRRVPRCNCVVWHGLFSCSVT